MRPVKFMRRPRNLPGVPVPAVGVIERAALTATAAFEAFLVGRPAIALGPNLTVWAIGRMSTMASLRTEILNALNEPVSEDFVIDQVARLMSVRFAFLFNTPPLPGEPMLRRQNMQQFLSALLHHLERERSSQHHPVQSIA